MMKFATSFWMLHEAISYILRISLIGCEAALFTCISFSFGYHFLLKEEAFFSPSWLHTLLPKHCEHQGGLSSLPKIDALRKDAKALVRKLTPSFPDQSQEHDGFDGLKKRDKCSPTTKPGKSLGVGSVC